MTPCPQCYNGAGIPVWSDLPPHYIHATLLLSCPVPQRETMEWLLSDVRQCAPTPRSFSQAAVLPCKVLPNHLPIWVLSFWDRLSEAYDTCLSWRESLNWVNTACASIQPVSILLRGWIPCSNGFVGTATSPGSVGIDVSRISLASCQTMSWILARLAISWNSLKGGWQWTPRTAAT